MMPTKKQTIIVMGIFFLSLFWAGQAVFAQEECTPGVDCYCDLYPEDDWSCNPCNPHGDVYDPDKLDCDPCEFYDPYWDDPNDPECGPCNPDSPGYDPDWCSDPCEFFNSWKDDPLDPQCGPCNEESPYFDPELCDPCDPFGLMFDPDVCDPCDPESPSFDAYYCNVCNEDGPNYDETAVCDPCDVDSPLYDPEDDFMWDSCNPWSCNYDSENPDCEWGDPCDPHSPDYDPYTSECLGWRPLLRESFDEADLANPPWTNTNWAISDKNHHHWNWESAHAAAASSGPGYPAGEQWMILGPINLTGMKAASIEFSTLRDIGKDAELVFCVSTSPEPDALLNGIEEWFHGSTGEGLDEAGNPIRFWDRAHFNLKEYANHDEVYFGWRFKSESPSPREGVFVDEIELHATNEEQVEGPQWDTILSQTFDDGFPTPEQGWATFNLYDPFANWEFEDWYFSASPSHSIGYDPASEQGYDSTMGTWMVHGPIDLTGKVAAEVVFSQYRDIPEDTDWLGFCMGAGDSPEVLQTTGDCYWFTGNSEDWVPEVFDMSHYASQDDVYIGWVFESESGSTTQQGVFVDDIEIWATSEEITDPFEEEFEGWWDIIAGPVTFDDADLSDTTQWTVIPSENSWVVTDQYHSDWNEDSLKSASAVDPVGSYPADAENWLFYGPIDLSKMVSAEASFQLLHDLEYAEDENWDNDDWLGFGVAFGPNPDDVIFEDWRTGSTWDFWDMAYLDLTPHVGRENVYLVWKFESKVGSDSKIGALIDEIEVWGQHIDVEHPDFGFEDDGFLIPEDDDFYDWSGTEGDTGDFNVTEIDNEAVAVLSGDQILYQMIEIPPNANELYLSVTYAITSDETEWGDVFCMSLTNDGSPGENGENILADFGCWDALDFSEYARDERIFEVFEERLADEDLESIKGGRVAFTVELYQNGEEGTGETSLFIDDVSVYVTGEDNDGGQNVAEQRDKNEPNDGFEKATPIICGQTLKGVFGEMFGGGDLDFFKLAKMPAGKFAIDIEAQSKRPPSAADTVITLFDNQRNMIAENDDEGDDNLDSRLIYDNTSDGATYYVKVRNFSMEGGPDHFYDIKVICDVAEVPPESDDGAIVTPEPDDPGEQGASWTVMVFANGDNDLGTNAYHLSREAIEKYVGNKKDFLNVVMQIDGHPTYSDPDQVNTLRYVVQPNGDYTEDVNKWDKGELNMGDPQTLIDFVEWAMANYPADHYYLAVDDHGNGPDGISWDMTSGNDQITPAELRMALKEITQNGDQKIDIFDYEACLMGLVENAYDLKDYVDYVAFFQPISWTSLNYPEYFRNLQADDTALTVARRIIRKYPVDTDDVPYTYSLIDTGKLEVLREKIDAFAAELMSADLDTIKAARNESQAFLGDSEKGDASQDTRGYIDLWDLADNIASKGIAATQAADIKAAVEDAVLEMKAVPKGNSAYTDNKVWDYSNAHGLSILFPSINYTFIEDYAQNYQMSADGQWDDFLTETVFGTGDQDIRARNMSTILIPRTTAPTSSTSSGALSNVIVGLQVLAGTSPSGVSTIDDVNDDERIGMAEVISMMKQLSQ